MAVIKKLANVTSLYLLTISLLFNSSGGVRAVSQHVSQGVLRIDLEKHFIPHQEIEELEESEDNISIEIDDTSYAQLREQQNSKIRKSFSKLKSNEPITLIQSTEGADEAQNISIDSESVTEVGQENSVQESSSTKTKNKQLISESADSNEDKKDDIQLQVPLLSRNDAVYMGTLYMGSPQSQPSKVVFDTGSEYLAVTSTLCDDKTSGNFKFKKYDPISGSFVQRDQLNQRCNTQSYDMHKSNSNKILSKASSKLTYGSAKLQGFIWQDYACLQPLKAKSNSLVQLKLSLKDNKCAYFQFLALYKSQGLGKNSDGILGLSPHKDMTKKKLHYLWSLKDNGIIDHAMVSFSITSKEMGETPYALFGGYNSSQIVGGSDGLKTFKNFPNWLGTWALEGQNMFYGGKAMQQPGQDTSYPAIIDTGSSQLSIPPDVFDKIRGEWAAAIPELDCKSDKTFCHVQKPCEQVSDKVKPVGFQMSDYVFEINPEQYLYKSSHKKCYFVVHKCRLPGKNKNLFLIGDAFLKHFYSVYDFDKDTVSLGVNLHSKDKVSMYKPGQRPENLVKTQTQDADVNMDADSFVQTKIKVLPVGEAVDEVSLAEQKHQMNVNRIDKDPAAAK